MIVKTASISTCVHIQTVFMTEEGYKEMNDWWNASPD